MATVFAIEFAGDENVQRGILNQTAATASENLNITAVADLDLAMPWLVGGTSFKNAGFPGSGSSDNGDAQVAVTMVDIDTINFQHSISGGEASQFFSWEVVEWLVSAPSGQTHQMMV